MSDIRRLFVLNDPIANSNKFWEGTLSQTGVTCKWGRVGAAGSTKFFPNETSRDFENRIREKTNKGYFEAALIESFSTAASVSSSTKMAKDAIAKAASKEIAKGDAELEVLMRRLAQANRHEITKATGGSITFNADGMAQTALGVVTEETISNARSVLADIQSQLTQYGIDGNLTIKSIGRYMVLIPQKVGARAGWHRDVFGTTDLLTKQSDLLDKLESSLVQARKEILKQQKSKDKSNNIKNEPLFEVIVKKLTNATEIKRITAFFKKSSNRQHTSSTLKIKNIFQIEIPEMKKAFEADGYKVGNISELWHGTRTFNVLSILKSGLIIPKSSPGSTFHVTGRMFGDGLYFSDQSTKALNYSQGYWDHSSPRDNSCFMFLADVAMGKTYTPSRPTGTIARGFDSMFAKAGVSGVLNNEMIVYRLGQANLKFLVEFEN